MKKKKYKYTLQEDYNYKCDIKNKPFEGIVNGKKWLVISEDGNIFIPKGYSWDGATGVPDFESTYYPTLVHDALYQFLERGMPFTRKEIDDIFLKQLREYGFKASGLYYLGVRLFGGIFVKLTR